MKLSFKILLAILFIALNTKGQWFQTTCPAGGAVQAMTTTGSTVVAGTQTLGIYRSANAGSNWTQVNSGLGNNNILSFAISGSTLFAGTNGGGIYLSSDNGTSWTAASIGLTNQQVSSLAVSGSTVFAGTLGGGVFSSTNNGSSWTSISSFTMNQVIWSLATSGSTLYSGANSGKLYATNDNGTTWNSISTGLPNQDVRAIMIGTNYLLAGVTNGGVFKSVNNGSSWTLSNSGITNLYPKTFLQIGTSVCVGTVNDAFISNDMGGTWTSMNTSNLDVWAMTMDATKVYLGTWNNGVWIRDKSQVISGISEIETDEANVSLYPNPTNGKFLIKGIFDSSSIHVYNSIGELVLIHEFRTTNSELNLSEHASGLYFIRIGNLTKKIIKE